MNGMSGLLCAHLNAVTLKSSYQPLYSFRPHGAEVGESITNTEIVWIGVSMAFGLHIYRCAVYCRFNNKVHMCLCVINP